jgi:hypothetical protein
VASGTNNGVAALNQGINTGAGWIGAGLTPYETIYGQGNKGASAYADATGANGAEGAQRALANFQGSPAYQFQLQQGDENILRNQARTGQLASGGTNVDLMNYGQGLANQTWGQYQQGLTALAQSAECRRRRHRRNDVGDR